MRTTCRRRDDGFTVVELVVAAAILFFAMTALIGLLGASTNLTASAKSRSVLTNAIASEIEQIRTLPIAQVEYDTAGGAIPHSKTLPEKDGVTVRLSFQITNRMTQNRTKEITVRGIATRRGFPAARYSSFAVVRDRIGGQTGGTGSGGPLIEFTENTPAVGSVLDGPNLGGTNQTFKIEAHAWSDSGAAITRFEFTVDGTDNVTGSKASIPLKNTNTVYADLSWHDVPSPTSDQTWSFDWNTDQRDSENLSEVMDGVRTVTIIAYDDQNRASPPVKRWFLVDNRYPKTAPTVTLTNTKNANFTQTVALDWTPVLDGDYPADHYRYFVHRKNTASQVLGDWADVTGSMTADALPARPLAYYAARVQPLSKLGKDPSLSPWGYSPAVLTSPVLTGAHKVKRVKYNGSNDTWTFTSGFTLEKPDVPCTVSSVILERTGGGAATANIDVTAAATAAWGSGSSYTYSDAVSQTIKKNAAPVVPEYRLKVVLTPTGTTTALTAYSQYCKCKVPAISNTDPEATGLTYEQRW